jgi:hypothetical protein
VGTPVHAFVHAIVAGEPSGLPQNACIPTKLPFAPQLPQFDGSKRGSTQAGPQVFSGAPQGSTQRPSTHSPVAQSLVFAQWPPNAQVGQVPPPQSTSDSEPFFAPSLQLERAQTLAVQTSVVQSVATAQAAPTAQPPHEPPQSTSVSVPFFSPSVHAPPPHTCRTHRAVAQSSLVRHAFAAGQGAHEPPQSTSLSVPLSTPSEQVGVFAAQPPSKSAISSQRI